MSIPGLSLLNPVIKEILEPIKNEIVMLKGAKNERKSLETRLKLFLARLDDVSINYRGASSFAQARIEEMRNYAHEMEDYIERYVSQQSARWKKVYTLHQFAKDMENINKQLEAAGSLLGPHSLIEAGPASATPALPRNPVPSEPAGIDKAKGDLLELIGDTGREPEKLRVISIWGFGGSGKATLANAVFNSVNGVEGPTFDLCAKVDTAPDQDAEVPRSRKNETELLRGIIKQFWNDATDADTARPRDFIAKQKFEDKRYLIVLIGLDDEKQWTTSLISTFRDKGAAASRIIVTTRTEGLAKIFSSNENDYIYKMRKIGQTASRAILEKVDHPVQQKLMEKCDGHPLALYSVNKHVWSIHNRPVEHLEFFCKHLGSSLHQSNSSQSGTDCFAYLRGVLVDAYTGLPKRSFRSSMLYLSIFSNDGHLIKRNKITSRWVAEGYGINNEHKIEQEIAEENFEELIERDIIEPVSIRNRSMTSNKCRTRGIVHEFVLHKGISENFILSTSGPWEPRAPAKNKGKEKVRHIFISDNKVESSGNLDLSRVRSLTISSSGGLADAFSKFSEYELMRVLDLEECTDVNNSHVTAICELWNLRYLSLGPQITELPGEITQLPLLESLHISKKMDPQLETKLPVEVIGMPYLLHLTGKFRILYKTEEVTIELCKNSNLETFAGFIADDNETGLLLHMPNMTKLRKVKIWCCEPVTGDANKKKVTSVFQKKKKKVTSDANKKKEMEEEMNKDQLHTQLLQTIQWYTRSSKENKEGGSKKSMSIDFQGLLGGSQCALKKLHDTIKAEGYSLGSLKLHDKSFDPAKAALLTGHLIVTKLCLSLTTVEQDILSTLGAMNTLFHLKLIAHNINGNLVMEVGKFPSLESLCFKVSGRSAANVVIEVLPTSLPELVSLQLLCEHLYVNHIEHLRKLQYIELHHKVNGEARRALETAARNHLNKPSVLPFVADDEENSDAGAAARDHLNRPSVSGAAAQEPAGDLPTANGPPPAEPKKSWKKKIQKGFQNWLKPSTANGKQQAL